MIMQDEDDTVDTIWPTFKDKYKEIVVCMGMRSTMGYGRCLFTLP